MRLYWRFASQLNRGVSLALRLRKWKMPTAASSGLDIVSVWSAKLPALIIDLHEAGSLSDINGSCCTEIAFGVKKR